MFANPTESQQSEADLLRSLGEPSIGDVRANTGYSLTSQVPRYLVLPASFASVPLDPDRCQAKIVDFGEAFLCGQQRQTRCPLVFRAPETVLATQWDMQADIWSLGCTVLRPECAITSTTTDR